MEQPPDGHPIYRLVSGPDDSTFCARVSEALMQGYELHGSPCIMFNGPHTYAAQALIWPAERWRRERD